mgnify:CR=1 FL=1
MEVSFFLFTFVNHKKNCVFHGFQPLRIENFSRTGQSVGNSKIQNDHTFSHERKNKTADGSAAHESADVFKDDRHQHRLTIQHLQRQNQPYPNARRVYQKQVSKHQPELASIW